MGQRALVLRPHHVTGGDREAARATLRDDLNTGFARLGYRYELTELGQILRLTDEPQDLEILEGEQRTADAHLSELVDRAKGDFFDRAGQRTAQALEAIVDAFERIKTLENLSKAVSIPISLERISSQPQVRQRIDKEMRELTEIGNSFEIRHHEVAQLAIESDEIIDYLFYRYYNVVRVFIRAYPPA